MTTLHQREPAELTARRFERMRPFGGDTAPPPVDRTGLPPGPRWPVWLQTVALLRFRHWFHPYLHQKYGDIYTVRLMPKGRPLVFFTRPEHAKEIFAGDPEIFHAGKGNAILGPVMGEHSLLLQDGAEHKRARKLLMPAFNGHALRDLPGRWSPTSPATRSRTGRPGSSSGRHDRMNVLTLEVILRVVFGVTDEKRLAALRPRVNATVNVSPAVLLVGASRRCTGSGRGSGPWQNQIELDELMYAEIRERRAAPDLAERTDVLSRLIRAVRGGEGRAVSRAGDDGDRLTDMELRDQLVTLLLAGHETTATALAWALYELGRDPGLMRRTQAATAARVPATTTGSTPCSRSRCGCTR